MKEIMSLSSLDKNAVVLIENGELIGYQFDKEELMHQKGSPGWEHTDIEMFPVIGPTSANKNKVITKKGDGIQDQHGFLRLLDYELTDKSNTHLVYEKKYKANTRVTNDKFPENSNEEFVFWPFDFSFKKRFEISNTGLKIVFELDSDKEMPFMLGYHPAFKLSGNKKEFCMVGNKKITIQDVIDKGGPSYPFFNTHEITLVKESGLHVTIKETGFGNMMLWTEFDNMICIEPITQYPDLENQKYSEKNMRISKEKELFTVEIIPFK